ncbi:rRNA 2'-O-methyltransferase fibrillarin-like [Musca vetustissima]|uniref:rRNA 2'-O-methyltransferase fibrillarin-like n=1 Tax=Musca vetustissima TaxID=27455 RepID=UPI002AB63D01|nr:rRNA 2'-O-methyltransferase fibrillarin-like [Musca vetustissima]
MRVFLTLCSLLAVGLAKPQYNYGNGVSGTFGSSGSLGSSAGVRFAGGFSSGSAVGQGSHFNGGSSFGGSLGGGSSLGGSLGGISSLGGSLGGNSAYGGAINGGSSLGVSHGAGSSFGGASSLVGGANTYHQSYSSGHSAQFEAPLVHKQFITVSAPEDSDSLSQTKHLVIGRPQKNYRVVFIKAPSSSSSNVKLSAEFAPKEEKTVIYVLSKKDSALEVNDIATPAPTVPSKPEVFFIKYKTEQEAQHAQRQIQAEYDKIQGSSEHTDAGVAPQQSVVGILDGVNGGGVGSATTIASGSVTSGISNTGVASESSFVGSGSSGSFVGSGPSASLVAGGSSGSFTGSSDSVTVKSAAYLPPTTTH